MSEPEFQDPPVAADAASGSRRCGFIAVIGAPNAGKSTLVNALVGAKVTIVSHKVQTTRTPVRGIAIVGDSQLVFMDTPGIFKPKRRLDRAMVGAAWGGVGEADIVALLVDASKGLDEEVAGIVARLADASGRMRPILLLNKVDRVRDKPALLALAALLAEKVAFARVFMISALEGSGIDDVKAWLAAEVPPGPWHYPEDDISDLPVRMLAAEITRERIYNWLHDELPYAITVETTSFKEQKAKGKLGASVRIEQTIFVERDSQKKIVLGKGGDTIKRISSEARQELMEILETTVHLFVFVKVREGWEKDPERYREMGLEFPKE
ncbi:MAG: GTPase Era [Hyphomicrobiaceae bacterium]|nr:GTPase Era [Hyphomicrobiaceae bacterium]